MGEGPSRPQKTMKRVTLTIPWPLTPEETRDILSYAFQVTLITYVVLFLLESLKPGFVTNYLSLQRWLWATIGTGVLATAWPAIVPASRWKRSTLRGREYVWLAILTLGTMFIVLMKTRSLGWLAPVVATLTGVAVLGLSLLVYLDHGRQPE